MFTTAHISTLPSTKTAPIAPITMPVLSSGIWPDATLYVNHPLILRVTPTKNTTASKVPNKAEEEVAKDVYATIAEVRAK